jgi:hypothetical protein
MSLEIPNDDSEVLTYEWRLWCPSCGKDIPDQDLNDLGDCVKCAQKQIDWAANPEEVKP